MKKSPFILLLIPVLITGWYFVISFLNVEMNPLLWTYWSRFGFVVASMIVINRVIRRFNK